MRLEVNLSIDHSMLPLVELNKGQNQHSQLLQLLNVGLIAYVQSIVLCSRTGLYHSSRYLSPCNSFHAALTTASPPL